MEMQTALTNGKEAKRRREFRPAGLAALLLILYSGLSWAGPMTYTAINLGTLGGTNAYGTAVNDSGQVTGFSDIAEGSGPAVQHAFLYSGGIMTDLGTLGGTYSYGRGINNKGQVTGDALTASSGGSVEHAFLYSGGIMTDLGTLGGESYSYAYGINDNGQITGFSGDHAFLYSNGTMIDLGTLGGSDNVGFAINNSGQITGTSSDHAFLYSGGAMIDLSAVSTPAMGYAINDRGQIAGISNGYAFLYSSGTMTDLGTLGGDYSWAQGINDSGQVTGASRISGTCGPPLCTTHAFIYTDGAMYDLNSLVTDGLNPGTVLGQATDISDSGFIVADGVVATGPVGSAYLLVPNVAPEPASFTLIVLGGVGLSAMWSLAQKIFGVI